MTMVVGGSSGITFPDSTNLPASSVSAALSPAVTDTANVMTIQPNVVVAGTAGLTANGTTYTSATAFSPVNTVAPVVTGTAQVGQTLSCTTGTWTGIATITYAYQWQFGTTNIPSATSSTYVISGTYVGQTIRCVVTATNPAGSTSANSNSTSAVTGAPFTLEYLVVAGGGGGGGFISGGGGAGGLRNASGLSLSTYTSYTVTVGAGGAVSTNGNNSIFASITSTGGGSGGTYESDGANGGSGGGSGGTSGTPSRAYSGGGAIPSGQGNVGGNTAQVAIIGAAGGGGAGGPGTSSTGNGNGQNGGSGASSTLSGTLAGGGGGGNRSYDSGTGGDGGSGGGGNGSGTNHLSSPGGVNTGGGGGGGGFGTWDYSPSAGGSGIVVIKFPSTLTATFSAGVTRSSSTAGGFTTVTITATSTTSETVTFS